MLTRNLILSFLLVILSACSSQTPNISGSNAVWTNYISIDKDIIINDLNIRLVKTADNQCIQGFSYKIELNGQINSEATFVIDNLLNDIEKNYKCRARDGSWIVPWVTLNSTGGYVDDGIELGRIFRKYEVATNLVYGQNCSSSCAFAFVGGKFRDMQDDTELMFHSPYYTADFKEIYCTNKKSEKVLEDYFIEMLNPKLGKILFDKTMNYCSTSDGWTVNKGGAEMYGLTTR